MHIVEANGACEAVRLELIKQFHDYILELVATQTHSNILATALCFQRANQLAKPMFKRNGQVSHPLPKSASNVARQLVQRKSED